MARSFYQGSYAFRSLNGLFSILVTGAFGGAFSWVSVQCFTELPPGELGKLVGTAFAIAAIGLLGASLHALTSVLLGRVETVSVTTEGITHGQRFIPWEDISEFYGTAYANGICLGYTPAGRKFYRERTLFTTPLLASDQYRTLAEEIREHISVSLPHVRIEAIPREPTGD